jgi:hypothetical protein
MNKYKKSWIIAGIIIAILALTNPTNSDFKSYLSVNGFYNTHGGRINYFGIFSIFKVNVGYNYTHPNRKYIGVFKNFILINISE